MSHSLVLPAAGVAAAGVTCLAVRCWCDGRRDRALENIIRGHHTHQSDYRSWSALDVAAWLYASGHSLSVARIVYLNKIEGSCLDSLQEEHLTGMGLVLGDRIRVLQSVVKLCQSPNLDTSGIHFDLADCCSEGESDWRQQTQMTDEGSYLVEDESCLSLTDDPQPAPTVSPVSPLPQGQLAKIPDALRETLISPRMRDPGLERLAQKITDITRQLSAPEFQSLPPADKQQRVMTASELLGHLLDVSSKLTPEAAAMLAPSITSAQKVINMNAAVIMKQLEIEKRQAQRDLLLEETRVLAERRAALEQENAETQEEEDEEEGDEVDPAVDALQGDLSLIPKIIERLQSDDFSKTATHFEMNVVQWLLHEATENYSRVLSSPTLKKSFQERTGPSLISFVDSCQAAKDLCEKRTKEVRNLGKRGNKWKAIPSSPIAWYKSGDLHVLSSCSTHPHLAGTLIPTILPSAPTPGALRAILIAPTQSGGTEAVEMRFLAHVLTRTHDYECTVLTGSLATKETLISYLDEIRNEASWRSEEGSASTGPLRVLIAHADHQSRVDDRLEFRDGSIPVTHLIDYLPKDSAVVIDTFATCSLWGVAPQGQLRVSFQIDPNLEGILQPAPWLFDGFFIPALAKVSAAKSAANLSLGGIARGMQICLAGDDYACGGDDEVSPCLTECLAAFQLAAPRDVKDETEEETEEECDRSDVEE